MNELKVIDERIVLGKEFRIFGDFENPLFLAKDVAEWIEHSNPSKMLNTVDDEEKTTLTIRYNGNMTTNQCFLTEDGLYEILMLSRKPIAKEFKKQVKEILKTIRKTGGYVSNDEMFLDTYFPFIDESAKAVFKQTLETVRKQNEVIQNQKKEIEEKNNEIIHKNEVITGLVEDIDIYTKITIVNRIIKRCGHKNGSYGNRYNEMYKCFREMFHIDLSARCEGYNMKQQKKKDRLSIIKYAEKFNHMDNLYKVACKLYETEVNALLDELRM